MSRNKRGGGADSIYDEFSSLYGTSFKNNPTTNRVAVLERMYFRVLAELATNRFKWLNMPDSVDVRFMEMTLFYNALSVFYFDIRYDKFFALRGGGTNWNNMMDNPVGFSVVGNNFVGRNLSALRDTEQGRKAIPIWANYLRVPDLDIVMTYARKFAELDRTIEINSLNARQSKILAFPENMKLSIANIARQIDEGQNGISINGNLADMEFIKALDLGVLPDSHEKLHILKVRLWNECMGLLGIDNANQDKKERLVANEVDANNGQTDMMRFVALNSRKKAAEEINDYYGLKVEVVFHTEYDERKQQIMDMVLAEAFGNNEANAEQEV